MLPPKRQEWQVKGAARQACAPRHLPRTRCREADHPLDQAKKKGKIEIEALAVGGAGEPVDEAVQPRSVDLGQTAEGGKDLAIELDARA